MSWVTDSGYGEGAGTHIWRWNAQGGGPGGNHAVAAGSSPEHWWPTVLVRLVSVNVSLGRLPDPPGPLSSFQGWPLCLVLLEVV